jgi:hypothetical protein
MPAWKHICVDGLYKVIHSVAGREAKKQLQLRILGIENSGNFTNYHK